MNTKSLRDYIRLHDEELAARADTFWRIAQPIVKRQNRVNSNENAMLHVETVELNIWRLIEKKLSEFNVRELFLLSCCACCHDFDKGLFEKLPDDVEHGQASGDFIVKEFKVFLQSFHEAVVIKQIVSLHNLDPEKFQAGLKKLKKKFSLSSDSINRQRLSVVLKAADILHTDSSRIASIGVDIQSMKQKEREKHLARESISGWYPDGTRIIITAIPCSKEHYQALQGAIEHIKTNEWPAVEDKLGDYNLPYKLEFDIEESEYQPPKHKPPITEDSSENKKYTLDNSVFNVPYKQKGNAVIGRDKALQELRDQLTKKRGTAIGQTAGFQGMGGLGKTQLAVEYAYKFKQEYPNGVIWISADQDIDAQLSKIASHANWVSCSSEHSITLQLATQRLTTYSDCLIIFDNVLEDQTNIEPFFPKPHANPHLILTSRFPQSGFSPIDLNLLDPDLSLKMLAKESERDFACLDEKEKDAAKDIAQALSGLPLAIEIAGAYLKHFKSSTFVQYKTIFENNP